MPRTGAKGTTRAHSSSSSSVCCDDGTGEANITAVLAELTLSGWSARAAVICEAGQPCTLASEAEMSRHKAMHDCTTLPVARPKASSSSVKAAYKEY